MLSLPGRVAALRTTAGLTAMELGSLAGLSKATVAMIESGKRPDPASSTLAQLARVLGDEAGWLLTGDGEPPSTEAVHAAVERARSHSGSGGAAA